jgi:hypothetical protein
VTAASRAPPDTPGAEPVAPCPRPSGDPTPLVATRPHGSPAGDPARMITASEHPAAPQTAAGPETVIMAPTARCPPRVHARARRRFRQAGNSPPAARSPHDHRFGTPSRTISGRRHRNGDHDLHHAGPNREHRPPGRDRRLRVPREWSRSRRAGAHLGIRHRFGPTPTRIARPGTPALMIIDWGHPAVPSAGHRSPIRAHPLHRTVPTLGARGRFQQAEHLPSAPRFPHDHQLRTPNRTTNGCRSRNGDQDPHRTVPTPRPRPGRDVACGKPTTRRRRPGFLMIVA